MAKTDIRTNPKFRKLCRRLNLPDAHALGHLECLWLTSYTVAANPVHFRDSEEIEAAADWRGKDGDLAQVLIDIRFLDQVDGGFVVHDMADHAPDFVQKRLKRADGGGQRRTTADNGPIEHNIKERNIEERKKTGQTNDPFFNQFNQQTRNHKDTTWPLYVECNRATGSNSTATAKTWGYAFDRRNPTTDEVDAIVTHLTEYARIAKAANGDFVPHLPNPDKYFSGDCWTAELPKLGDKAKPATVWE